MTLSSDGYMRPQVGASKDEDDTRSIALFEQACPGRRVIAPQLDTPNGMIHPTFGRAEGAWVAWAHDPEFRRRGSSGGAITALMAWFLEQNPGSSAVGVGTSPASPIRSVPVRITTRDEALNSAGSRYAPASALAGLSLRTMPDLVAGKPCEASALRQLAIATGTQPPFIFSFFCAGTPSQRATECLLDDFGFDKEQVTQLHYRGFGWPGSFTASDGERTESTPANDSWMDYFGRMIQGRCKICVDGTGESADVAVGDYWYSDQKGNTVYEEAEGRSVVIARSVRGRETDRKCDPPRRAGSRPAGP